MHALASHLVSSLAQVVVAIEEKAPDDKDVKAGWIGFAVFMFLIVAVALLGWSLTRHLRKAEDAEAHGAFGTGPAAATADAPRVESTDGPEGSGASDGSAGE